MRFALLPYYQRYLLYFLLSLTLLSWCLCPYHQTNHFGFSIGGKLDINNIQNRAKVFWINMEIRPEFDLKHRYTAYSESPKEVVAIRQWNLISKQNITWEIFFLNSHAQNVLAKLDPESFFQKWKLSIFLDQQSEVSIFLQFPHMIMPDFQELRTAP